MATSKEKATQEAEKAIQAPAGAEAVVASEPEAPKVYNRKIKYMGSSDIVTLSVGEDFNGRLAKPLTKEVVWNWGNHHIVESHEVGLLKAAVELLLEEKQDNGQGELIPRFVDVTEADRYPTNRAEQMWLGMAAVEYKPEERAAVPEPSQTPGALNPSGVGGLITGSPDAASTIPSGASTVGGAPGVTSEVGGSGNDAAGGSAGGTSTVGGSGNDA